MFQNIFGNDEEDHGNESDRATSTAQNTNASALAKAAVSQTENQNTHTGAAAAAPKPRRLRKKVQPRKPSTAAQSLDWSAVMRHVADTGTRDISDENSIPVAPDGVLISAEEQETIRDRWELAPFDDDDWTDVVEMAWDTDTNTEYPEDIEAPGYDPEYCYLCACTQSETELEGNPNLGLFVQFLNENYAKMRRKELAKQGQRIYNSILRPHTKQKKAMRCKVILDHIEKHAPTLRIQLEHQNRTLNSCLMEQSRQLREQELGTKRKRLSAQHVNTYLKLAAFQNDVNVRLSKMRPDMFKR